MVYVGSIMFVLGIFLSAFFSGAETGFYRVTRVRLLLDGLGGDPIARTLLWLTNRADPDDPISRAVSRFVADRAN